jgi:hypothetical protein
VREGSVAFGPAVSHAELVGRLIARVGLERGAAEWIGMRALGEPDADIASSLALPARARAWWRAHGTRETLRPWRSYAALAPAGPRLRAASARR